MHQNQIINNIFNYLKLFQYQLLFGKFKEAIKIFFELKKQKQNLMLFPLALNKNWKAKNLPTL